MQWLNKVVDEVIAAHPDGEILVESGVSPSGTYHVGTLREVLTCDAIMLELRRRGRKAKHIHYVDDLDPLRKIPNNVPEEFQKYLGRPYCDIPAPDGSKQSYADYFLNDFLSAARDLQMDMQVIRSHEKYRRGSMTPAIEKALDNVDRIRQIIEQVSGRQVEKDWAPIQVLEDSYLKNRRFLSIDSQSKTIVYLDSDDQPQVISYLHGEVKLNWRVDWPARWWLMGVHVEPFGRDHATKGGSYDTGAAIIKNVFGAEPPLPVPYNFINSVGETKKMSKSSGKIIAMSEMTKVLPAEVVRFFTLRYSPDKLLFFDQHGVAKLIDDFAQLLAKTDKTPQDQQLINICTMGLDPVVSNIPFSHLVASYQAALQDPERTLEVISRTEHKDKVESQKQLILNELSYIHKWLEKWAPEDIKFTIEKDISHQPTLTDSQKDFLKALGDIINQALPDADGEWFHKAVYDLTGQFNLKPKEAFESIYKITINKNSGPRAGWFLSILPRDWLIKRLRLED